MATRHRNCNTDWTMQEDDQRMCFVQQIMPRSADMLRRSVAQVEGQGLVSPCPMCALAVIVTGLKNTYRSVSSRHGRGNATGGVRRVAANTTGETRTESWSYMTARMAEKQESFSGARCAARRLRQLDRRPRAFGESSEERRHSD